MLDKGTSTKTISKATDLDYDELKDASKKGLKMAKRYDSELLGRIEEILELQDIISEEEMLEFDIDTLKLFCKIKEIEYSDTEKSIRHQVWKFIEEQLDMDDSDDSDDESEPETDEEEDVKEIIQTIKEETPEKRVKSSKKSSKNVMYPQTS